jgi:hypothetical protein
MIKNDREYNGIIKIIKINKNKYGGHSPSFGSSLEK